MRLFVAIPLPPAIADAGFAALPSGIPGIRRVKPEHMHITLAFLGEMPDDRRDSALRACATAALDRMPFDIALDWVGRFASSRATTTIWLGIGEGADALGRLAAALREALEAESLRYDRKPFAAHVTVARLRAEMGEAERRAAASALRALKLPPLRFRAERVELIQSRLSPKGPQYSSLGSFAFGGQPGRSAKARGLHSTA